MFASNAKTGLLRPALWHQILNVSLCVTLALVLFAYVRKNVYFFPITLEAIWQISLAETNRRKSKRRVRNLKRELDPDDVEKKPLDDTSYFKCLASVVGYREDPTVFTKCMESYNGCIGLETLLVGIDGDEAQDVEMANIVRKVYPKNSIFINLEEPLAHLAVRLAEDYVIRELKDFRQPELPDDWTFGDLPQQLRQDAAAFAMDQVYAKAVEVLQKHDALYSYQSSFRVVCISQPHVSKKAILFTNLVMSAVLGKFNHVPYLWTGDSDTWVLPDTLPLTIGCMVADPKVGGSCSLLGIHNGHESYVSRLGSAIYWSELAITRGQTGAIDAVDCQPGPCAAFLLTALTPNLFDWYTQTSMGVKTIVNEDRHLTTKLLLDGWKVTFNTESIAYTDTPTTLLRWLLQQIRWARATQIETFQYPAVYAIHGPIFFLSSMNRVYGPLSVMVLTIRYVFFGDVVRAYSIYDILSRIFLVTTYNLLCYRREAVCSILFLAISQVFYQLPLPGLIVYASITALEGGWGTSMRNRKETQKAKGAGWEHIRAIAAVVTWTGVVAAALGRWFANSYAPNHVLPLMWGSAMCVMGGLYYLLLRQSQRA